MRVLCMAWLGSFYLTEVSDVGPVASWVRRDGSCGREGYGLA